MTIPESKEDPNAEISLTVEFGNNDDSWKYSWYFEGILLKKAEAQN